MIETILKYYKPPFKTDECSGLILDADGWSLAMVTKFAQLKKAPFSEVEREALKVRQELCYLLNLAAANQISDNGMAESQ